MLKFFREGGAAVKPMPGPPHHHPHHHPHPPVPVVPKPVVHHVSGHFETPYHFKREVKVVIKVCHRGKHLRVHPSDHHKADSDGGKGEFAQWHVQFVGGHGHTIMLKSCKTGKYLRIHGSHVDVKGVGGTLLSKYTYVIKMS